MEISYANKTALVTGGSTGIGFAAAQALVAAGATVVVTGQNEARLREAVAQLGERSHGIVSDNASVAAIGRLAERVHDLIGGLDLLFANAGVTWPGRIEEVTEESWDGQMAINLKGAFFTVQRCLPLIRRGGAIVVTTSCVDELGLTDMAVYSATKAALRSLVRTLAVELADRGIRVNGIAPGPIDTPIFDKLFAIPEQGEAARREEAAATALKRMGRPEEVARVVLFAGSEAASYVTGANLRVDGGWTDV